MLKRLAMDQLLAWKNNDEKNALLIMGARQVGKTTLIRQFAKQNYQAVVEINFFENPEAIELISGARNTQDLLYRFTVITNKRLIPGKTLIFLDEIQECQDLLTWSKFLVELGEYDIILSGSLLGLDSYTHVRSLPVGFLSKLTIYPLNFEEFCMATELVPEVWEMAKEAILNQRPVEDYIHKTLFERFRLYLMVGGMPQVVQKYVTTPLAVSIRELQRDICDLYRHDIAKYVDDRTEKRRIHLVYDSAPSQLNRPHKRFVYTRLEKNLRFANLETAFDWLQAAGVCISCNRVTSLNYPLMQNADRSNFKLYLNDTGLLTSQFMGDVDFNLLLNKDSINYGSIYENFVAQELVACGITPYYYLSKKRGEIDFVYQAPYSSKIQIIEVKSGKDYKRHSALTNVLTDGLAHEAIILHNGNVTQNDKRLYLPIYAASLIPKL